MHLCCFYALLSFEGLLMVTINETFVKKYVQCSYVLLLLLRSGNEVGIKKYFSHVHFKI